MNDVRTLALVGLATIAAAVSAIGPAACSRSSDPASATPLDGATAAFVYRGEGCAYPVRVRLGLGGDTKSDGPGYADPSHTAVVTWETTAATRAARVRIATTPAGPFVPVRGCGLEPGRTYYYQAGGGAPAARLGETSGMTYPEPLR